MRDDSTGKLLAALRALVEESRGGGDRPTIAAVVERSGVSRPTAYRSKEFRAALEEARLSRPPVPPDAAPDRPSRAERIADMLATIEFMATVIQELTLEVDRLNRELLRRTSDPVGVSDRKVVDLKGRRRQLGPRVEAEPSIG